MNRRIFRLIESGATPTLRPYGTDDERRFCSFSGYSAAKRIRLRGVRGSLSKVIESLAAGYPFSIVHLLEFENRRRILFK
jgi:hypothetical protein